MSNKEENAAPTEVRQTDQYTYEDAETEAAEMWLILGRVFADVVKASPEWLDTTKSADFAIDMAIRADLCFNLASKSYELVEMEEYTKWRMNLEKNE